MAKREDLGIRVTRLARDVTPDQCAELLAIRLHSMCAVQRCPILVSHYREPPLAWLVREKMLVLGPPPIGWGEARKWRTPILTELGHRVLLHIAEEAMIAAGRMTSFSPAEDAGS